jgi:hypothetical protein
LQFFHFQPKTNSEVAAVDLRLFVRRAEKDSSAKRVNRNCDTPPDHADGQYCSQTQKQTKKVCFAPRH